MDIAILRAWLRRHQQEIFIVTVIFVVAAVPRLLDLGTFLTADEKNWIGRSYEFIRAFKDWRFNDMLQTTHPGVTTLWLSGISVTLKMVTDDIPFSFRNLIHFVKAAQLPIALANSLAVPVIYVLLRRLVQSRWVAVTAALLIALNPFLIGYARVAHVDALLGSFMVPAALAMMVYVRSGYRRSWLVLSAVLTALSLLTKAPAVFLFPFFGLVLLVYSPWFWRTRQALVARGRDMLLWLLVIGLLFVLLWPAMLFVPNPEGNVLLLKRDIGQAAVTPHHMVEDYTLNGAHYVYALLTRSTPITLAAAPLAVLWLLIPRRLAPSSALAGYKREVWLAAAFVFFFVVMMTLGAKKGDRYIVPVFFMLDVVAAAGFVAVAALFRQHQKIVLWALTAIAVVCLGVTVARYHPYAVAYSNPLFPDNLSQELGWGEGLEQVGAWLSENDPHAVVASWYPEELGAYTSAHVAHINAHEQGQVRYVVLYRNMFGRAVDHYANNFIDEYYKKREPVFVVDVAGKPFAWVYLKRSYERVVGELLPGDVVGQELTLREPPVASIEVQVATYSGTATQGTLHLVLREQQNGLVLHEAAIPVAQIDDNDWVRFAVPTEVPLADRVYVEISATGTVPDNAPTVRYSSQYDYVPTQMILNGEEKPGDLAVRVRYLVNGQEVSEEEGRLLHN